MTELFVQQKQQQKERKKCLGEKSSSSLVTAEMRKKLNTKGPVKKNKHDTGLGQP